MSDYRLATEEIQLGDAAQQSAIWLQLHHVLSNRDELTVPSGAPVLLLHGASANHGTFRVGSDLAGWLLHEGFDPWLLDWRGSGRVVADARNDASLRDNGKLYNYNYAAREDLPAAISIIRKATGSKPVGLVGHCMGGAVVAEAIALGHVSPEDVDRIVLLTMGLMYEPPIMRQLQANDTILERLARQGGVVNIDPNTAWPADLESLFEAWASGLRPHPDSPNEAEQLCNRLTFMYGSPFQHGRLIDDVHARADMLPEQFGGIPLHMFIHGAKNVRAGEATFATGAPNDDIFSAQATKRFQNLKRVALITGGQNAVWHRNSIDKMHEWLLNADLQSGQLSKEIATTYDHQPYGHQDLLWGKQSHTDVFPLIKSGLTGP